MNLIFILHLLLSFSISFAFDPKVSSNEFKTSPQGLIYFKDSSVILYHSSDDGSLKRSDNDGQSWKDVKLQDAKSNGGIELLVEHPFDSKVAYALSGVSNIHYYTKDQGNTWTPFKLPAINRFNGPKPLSFHRKNSNYLIVSGSDCPDGNKHSQQCVDKSVYTLDNFANGNQGTTLADKTFRCLWGHSNKDSDDSISQDAIVCLVEVDNTRKLALSTDFFRSSEYIQVDGKVLTDVLDFGTMSRYFVSAVGPNFADNKEIMLLTSTDLNKWNIASFPDDGKSKINHASAFTVLESSKHSLHIDVSYSEHDEGTLYTSNSKGNYFKSSLDHTSRSRNGMVDIETVEGIDGILIANVRENDHNIRTKISYDDGRTWKFLSIGNCKGNRNENGASSSGIYDCNVNLHAILDHKNIGRIFSSPAPGIIAGIGNTGRRLEDRSKGDFYISHDSGLTWIKAYNGPHFYEFADQGNIILAIEDKQEVEEVKYSLDRGITWSTFKLNDKVNPQYLLTTPDSTSMKFVLVAHRSKDNKPVVVSVNFDGIYANKCNMKEDGSGDFEKWYARYDSDSKPTCILGHKQYFWRKKADSKCYVGDLYHEQFASTEDCPCSEIDYECDEKFILNSGGKCVPTKKYVLELLQCKKGETYERSTGYSLVPGDTCKKDNGGKTLDGKLSVVCGSEKNDNEDNNNNDSDKADGKVKSHSHFFNGEIVNYFYLPIHKDFPGQETLIVQNNYDAAFITHDQGSTWAPLFEGKEILSIIPHPDFANVLYVLTFDSKLHISKDRGHNFETVKLPAAPTQAGASIDFHPKNVDWLIYIGEKGCDNPFSCKLGGYYSTNGGHSWDLLQEDVTRCSWVGHLLHKTSEKLVYCDRLVAEGFDVRKSLISSDDFFKTKQTVFESVVGYAFQSEFIVVATVSVFVPPAAGLCPDPLFLASLGIAY